MDTEKLYDLMDWAEIETLVYSEENRPREFLGPHMTEDGVLIQAYVPGQKSLGLQVEGSRQTIPMVLEDESGFFAALLPAASIPKYQFVFEDGRKAEDPYAFPCQIAEKDEERFAAGTWYDAADKLGAHPMKVDGVDGIYFAVWAPAAVRVSVVGDFNGWDGRALPMSRTRTGIFELFVPRLEAGTLYKYELKLRTGLTYLKADPCANASQRMPETASVVADLSDYQWGDANWMSIRRAKMAPEAPMYVYELYPAGWMRDSEGDVLSYRDLAGELVRYLLQMGYTHVKFTPLTEYPADGSMGYAPSGYFAPTARYGSPEDFMYLIDALHRAGIGVIMGWNCAYFARGDAGLSSFDGTCLYEHLDPKKGVHPKWNTLIFNYGRPEVTSFLISSALFWAEKYHVDGLCLNEVSSMLYLDYDRGPGEWIANIYGGNENLEAVEFLKHLNSILHQRVPGVTTFAEEDSGWPKVTGDLGDDGLGFDYKWNNGWSRDYLDYIQLDPYFRGEHQEDLIFSTVYAYSERYVLGFSHSEMAALSGSLLSALPGAKNAMKYANLRLSFAYMTVHPGRKLLYMGQDAGLCALWNPNAVIDRRALEGDAAQKMEKFTADLIRLYVSHPALYKMDDYSAGFEWISNLDWQRNLLIFIRKSDKVGDELLVVCNFSNVEYDDFEVGVPYSGKYKEIFNSDAAIYGGSGAVNPRVKFSRRIEADERPDSIKVKIAPLAVSVYQYISTEEKLLDNASAKKKAAKKGKRAKKQNLRQELEDRYNAVEAEQSLGDGAKSRRTEDKKA